MSMKELMFKYFKDNPNAVEGNEDAKHYKALKIKKSTYHNYKMEYRKIRQVIEANALRSKDPEKYFKGRLRKKFIFDDSKLF